MSMINYSHSGNRQKGFSMIEVLISLVLIGAVLIGSTAMQISGMQNNRSSYHRTQASIAAWNIADRIRINKAFAVASAAQYSINTSSMAIPASPNCITNNTGCDSSELAEQDIREWVENFTDVNGIGNDGASYSSLLPSGTGVVTASGSSFSVAVSWSEIDWDLGGGDDKASTTKTFNLDFTLTE